MSARIALLLGGPLVLSPVSSPRSVRGRRGPDRAGAGPASAELVARGRELFNDAGLSADRTWSCASCHPSEGHTDNKTYVGVTVVADGEPTGRSTPTLWGAGFRRAYSWAGTAPSLEANIRGIIVNRMKGSRAVAGDPGGPGGVRAVAGVPAESEPEGRRLALRRGPGGGEARVRAVHGEGRVQDRATSLRTTRRRTWRTSAPGGKFKVPSLRSVSRTGPYFHDGRYADPGAGGQGNVGVHAEGGDHREAERRRPCGTWSSS